MAFSLFALILLSGLAAVVFLILTIMKKKKAWVGLVSSLIVGAVSTVGLIIVFIFAAPTGTTSTVSGTSDESVEVDSENVSDEEETEEESTEEPAEDITELDVEVDETYEVNGLSIHIDNIEITEDDVKVRMTLNNDSDNSKSFHPDQHDLVIGNKQYGANMFMTKGDVSGEIHSGIEKSGTIRFLIEDGLDVSEIEEITLKLGNIFDDDSFESEDFDETITIN